MIEEEQIVFITTSIFTECFDFQQSLIKKYFPSSTNLIVDGSDLTKWPNSMFYWINHLKNRNEKYFILIDEDCFLTSKNEILKTLKLIEDGIYDFIGCPDGYHPFRTCNPIVINPFLLFGKIENINKIQFDFSSLTYKIKSLPGSPSKGLHYEWINSAKIKFKHSYKDDFIYPHSILSSFFFLDGKEPYYPLFWHLKDLGMKFGYLFPYVDKNLSTTNPKISEFSDEMAIHIWESRNFNNEKRLFGKTTKERFTLAKNYIQEKYK